MHIAKRTFGIGGIYVLLLIGNPCLSQFTPDYQQNFFDQKQHWSLYYDSIYSGGNHSLQGTGYNRFNRWVSFWQQFMPSTGEFDHAIENFKRYMSYRKAAHFHYLTSGLETSSGVTPPVETYASTSPEPETSQKLGMAWRTDWEEIGPRNQSDVLMDLKENDRKAYEWVNPHIDNDGTVKYNGHVAKIDRLFTHPNDESIVYACAGGLEGGGGGLYRSEDGGKNWKNLGTDQIPIPDVISFAVKPKNVLPSPNQEILFIGLSTGAVYRSTDDGNTWYEAGYHGTNPYPYVNSSKTALSLPYSFDFINFSYDRFEKNFKMLLVPGSSRSEDFSRLIVARYGGLYYSDNYGAPIRANRSTYSISNDINWKKFNLLSVIQAIPKYDPSTTERDFAVTDFEYYRKGGKVVYLVHLEIRENNMNEQKVENRPKGLRQYVLISSDYGKSWRILGNDAKEHSTQGEKILGGISFTPGNIEVHRNDPSSVYVAAPDDVNPTNSYLLHRFDLDSNYWEDLSEFKTFNNRGMPTQANGFAIHPENEEQWWIYTNAIRRKINGELQKDMSYGEDFHADARDILVLKNGTILMGHDGGVSQSTDGGVHFDITSEGLNAAQTDHVTVGQYPPYYIASGVWHAGLQVLNPETGKWHFRGTFDGAKGYNLFLNNQVYAVSNQFFQINIYSDFNNLNRVGLSGGPITGSENRAGRGYQSRRLKGKKVDHIYYTDADFSDRAKKVPELEFPLYSATPHAVPNDPDKLVVTIDDFFSGTGQRLLIYEGMSDSIPDPILVKEINLDQVYDPLLQQRAGFTDIEFDTRRNGDFWMVLKGGALWQENTQNRIVYYNGNRFKDITYVTDDDFNGQPSRFHDFININSIERDRQTGRLYIGTNFGVYYLDEQAKIWRKYSLNVPCFKTDIDILHCKGEIYAASNFRGIWKSELIRLPEDETLEWKIKKSRTWSERMNLFHTLVVEKGTTLTISDELVVFGDQKIIVKPGGKLILDGARITTWCGETWKGIELQEIGKRKRKRKRKPSKVGTLIQKGNASIEQTSTPFTKVLISKKKRRRK